MSRYLILILSLLFFAFFPEYASAFSQKMVPVSAAIPDLNKVLSQIKQKTELPIRFPSHIPIDSQQKNKKYYLSYTINENRVMINVDATPNCQGARYCSLGNLSIARDEKLQLYSDRNNKIITEPVYLAQSKRGNYTPGHALADYWSPNIQWMNKGVRYSLTWNASKKHLTEMANSMMARSK